MTRASLYKLVLFNVALLTVLSILATYGYVHPVFEQDASGVTYVIVGLFAWASIFLFMCAENLTRRQPSLHVRNVVRRRVRWLRDASGWMVSLGLIGTVVGFGIALSGLGEGSVSDASSAESTIKTLLAGVGTALNTTLVGAVLGLWHEVNVRGLLSILGDE